MSEDSETVQAAATGAAAAVAAVQDDQAEEARAERTEVAAEVAADAATEAADRAEAAADAAEAATEAAAQASTEANQASEVASEAATEAYSVQDDLGRLRTEMREGWQSFRTDMEGFLDERLGRRHGDEAQEVTVTHEQSDNSPESRSDGRSERSAESERPRHRFGHRR